MAYVALEKLINLHDGYRKVVRVDGQEMLLIQHEGERYLFNRLCPHADMPLDDASILGLELTCPWHLIRFSLISGKPKNVACPGMKLQTLVYEGNSVGVDSGVGSEP